MARAARTASVAVLAALCCVLLPEPAATAAPPLQTLSGLLTLSLASPAASLSTTGSTTSGSLGITTVIDGRIAAAGYDVSVTTTGFDLVGPTVTASPTTHIPPANASVSVTATTGGTASTTASAALPASPLFTFTYPSTVLSVDLLSTYTLLLTVTIPAQAAPGRYTGTVTQTVV